MLKAEHTNKQGYVFSECQIRYCILKFVSQCLIHLLTQLHLNVLDGGSLEPWPRVGKASQNTLHAGTDEFNRFVFELAQGYDEWLRKDDARPVLSYRLKLIMRMFRIPKGEYQSSSHIYDALKKTAPISKEETPSVSKEEAENIIHEILGSVFSKLSEGTQKFLIDSEYLYRQHRYRLPCRNEPLSNWNSILTMPFQASEHQRGEGWQKIQSGQPPELGTILYAIDFVLRGKVPTDARQKAAKERGLKLLQIYPRLKNQGTLIRRLKNLVSKHRNPASHGIPISSEKLEKSREILYQEDILRDFLSLLVK